MSSRCLANSQKAETKRRSSFTSQSVTLKKEIFSGKNVQDEEHTKHKVLIHYNVFNRRPWV